MKVRDYQIDNLKGILIFLVVFGHLIEYMIFKTNNEFLSYLYTGIYLFHMPLFIFISGYFSKKHNDKRIVELFLVYGFWQMIIYPGFIALMTDESFVSALNPFFNPQTSYWYLLSFIVWRIVTPTVSKIKFIFPISLVAGLLIGYSDINSMVTFSFARTIGFYPFFLAGYFITQTDLSKLRQAINKYVGILIFGAFIILGILFINRLSPLITEANYLNRPLFFRDTYDNYLIQVHNGVWIRSLVYLISFSATFTAFSFISAKKTILSMIGQNTLLIYLSHAMVVEFLRVTFFKNK